jgi:hypothetical protein
MSVREKVEHFEGLSERAADEAAASSQQPRQPTAQSAVTRARNPASAAAAGGDGPVAALAAVPRSSASNDSTPASRIDAMRLLRRLSKSGNDVVIAGDGSADDAGSSSGKEQQWALSTAAPSHAKPATVPPAAAPITSGNGGATASATAGGLNLLRFRQRITGSGAGKEDDIQIESVKSDQARRASSVVTTLPVVAPDVALPQASSSSPVLSRLPLPVNPVRNDDPDPCPPELLAEMLLRSVVFRQNEVSMRRQMALWETLERKERSGSFVDAPFASEIAF